MELSANAGNRTGDRTFKQDPRGRLHYSHGSSSTSTLSPHPAGTPFSRAGVNLSLPFLLFSSRLPSTSIIFLHPLPPPQNGALDFQIIEGNSGKDRGEIASFHLFPLLRTIFFSLTTLVILPFSTPIYAWLMDVLRSNPLDRYFPIRFQRSAGSVLDTEKPIVDVTQGGHRAGCRRATCPFIIDANSSSGIRVLGHGSVLSR